MNVPARREPGLQRVHYLVRFRGPVLNHLNTSSKLHGRHLIAGAQIRNQVQSNLAGCIRAHLGVEWAAGIKQEQHARRNAAHTRDLLHDAILEHEQIVRSQSWIKTPVMVKNENWDEHFFSENPYLVLSFANWWRRPRGRGNRHCLRDTAEHSGTNDDNNEDNVDEL